MNRQLRTLIISSLNGGYSSKNIFDNISYWIYQKKIYRKLEVGYLNPADFETLIYREIRADALTKIFGNISLEV